MKIHKRLIEEVVLTGPDSEVAAMFDYCGKHHYRISVSGPAGPKRGVFKIRAHREHRPRTTKLKKKP